MAITATITAGPTPALINQKINCVVNVANSGGSAVTILAVQPLLKATGSANPPGAACAAGDVDLNSPNNIVPAGGSVNVPFGAVFFAPSTGPIGAGSGTYDISCMVQTSDGSNTSPTAAVVTVNPLPLPVSEQ